MSSLPHVKDILGNLRKHAGNLDSEIHHKIIRGLVADGFARDGDGAAIDSVLHARQAASRGKLMPLRSALQAAEESPQNAARVRQLRARAKRMNFDMPLTRPLSLYEIDAAFSGQDRIETAAWKTTAAQLRIID
jgi:hypothetical protein